MLGIRETYSINTKNEIFIQRVESSRKRLNSLRIPQREVEERALRQFIGHRPSDVWGVIQNPPLYLIQNISMDLM